MKKLLFSLVALLFCATMAHAKHSLVATLNHNDTVSVYYGLDALQNAYSAAKTGDVITLSSGAFLAVNITKSVTIRGAGMEKDSINGIEPTVLLGNFFMYGSNITMEGIYHDEIMTMGYSHYSNSTYSLSNSTFSKCRFRNLKIMQGIYRDQHYSYSSIYNLKFSHCRICSIIGNGTAYLNNCIVIGPGQEGQHETYPYNPKSMEYEFTNCIIIDGSVSDSRFYNCIIRDDGQLASSNVAYNCIGRYTGSYAGGLFANTPGEGVFNTDVAADNLIFKTFTGGSAAYTDEETFELTDEAAAKYLGGDGTQVGIYGGVQPYSPETTLPKITKFTVAPKTTEEGMLNVDIEVSAAE